MLEVVANALRSPSARLIENCCRPYQNEKGEWGYCMTVWDAGHYHMISVSHTNVANIKSRDNLQFNLSFLPDTGDLPQFSTISS